MPVSPFRCLLLLLGAGSERNDRRGLCQGLDRRQPVFTGRQPAFAPSLPSSDPAARRLRLRASLAISLVRRLANYALPAAFCIKMPVAIVKSPVNGV